MTVPYSPVSYAYGQPTEGEDVHVCYQSGITAVTKLTPNSFYRILADLAPMAPTARKQWWDKLKAEVEKRSPVEVTPPRCVHGHPHCTTVGPHWKAHGRPLF